MSVMDDIQDVIRSKVTDWTVNTANFRLLRMNKKCIHSFYCPIRNLVTNSILNIIHNTHNKLSFQRFILLRIFPSVTHVLMMRMISIFAKLRVCIPIIFFLLMVKFQLKKASGTAFGLKSRATESSRAKTR